jgi:hypothetical protein
MAMATGSLRLALLAAALFSGATQANAAETTDEVPLIRLKPADPEMRRLITDGYSRSASFRNLVDEIHRSNAVVVVQFGLCANGRFRSCVTNIEGDERQRHVRIKVNTRTTDDRLIATIAHELQHAVEMLRDPDVTNRDTALALYRRIGSGNCFAGLSDTCETDAALALEERVQHELQIRAPR